MPSREKKDFTVEINYYGSAENKEWSYIPTEDSKKVFADYMGLVGNTVFFNVQKYSSRLDQKPDLFLLGLNIATGAVICETPISGDIENVFSPLGFANTQDKKNGLFLGFSYKTGANTIKDKPVGLAAVEVSENGKIIKQKVNTWSENFEKFIPISNSGKIEKFGYLYLHDIIIAKDGSIHCMAEGFTKVASALGIAAFVLAGNSRPVIGMAKLKITDMLTMKFDKNFDLTDAKIYDKDNHGVELPSGSEFASPYLLGSLVNMYGGFDYYFSSSNADNSKFNFCYVDGAKGGLFINLLPIIMEKLPKMS